MVVSIPAWSPHRTALLGVWSSIYITVLVLLMTSYPPHSGNDTMILAVVSIAVATVGVGLFRLTPYRDILFRYFDWVAGQSNANWFVLVVMVFVFMIILSFLWNYG